MKKTGFFLLVALFVMLFVSMAFAQANSDQIVMNKSDLTPEQLKKAQAAQVEKEVQDHLKSYGFAAGIGHEIGTAVNESLQAVTDNATKFADTKVGKVTMAVVVWKVIGKDLTGIVIGISMFIVGIPIWVWSYRRFLPKKYLAKETIAADGTKTRHYEYGYGEADKDVCVWWQVGHWVLMLIFVWVTLGAVIF